MDKIIDNTKGFHFTIVDNYILDRAGLSAMEQIVYVHLKKYASQNNKCFPGLNKLAEDIASSINTVRKVLKNLKDKGFIDVQQRFNMSNEYTLLPYPEYAGEIEQEAGAAEEGTGIGSVLKAYENNINPLCGSMEREKLISWLETYEGRGEIIIKAMEIAALNGVRKIKYIESILINWHKDGVRTLEQCDNYRKEWEERKRGMKNGAADYGTGAESIADSRYDFSKFSGL